MATLNYFVRSDKKGKEVNIWLRLRNGKDTDIRMSTEISIPAEYWNDKKGQPKDISTDDIELVKRVEGIEKKLKGIKTSILSIIDNHEKLTSLVVKECVESYLDGLKIKVSDKPQTMNEYIPYLISRMKDGSLLVDGKKYSTGTIKAWNSFNKTWDAFQSDYLKKKLNFNDITLETYSAFIDYCNKKEYTRKKSTKSSTGHTTEEKNIGYRESTKSKYITSLKVLLNYAFEDGLSTNTIQRTKKFSKQKRNAGGKKPYLNTDELEKIYKLKLESGSMLDKVRDIFLIGCYTGQRVSDYSNIKQNNIDSLSNGKKVFRIKQQKTGTEVVIPFLNGNIETILEKWNNELPRISDVLINRHIKTICEMAGITEKITIMEIIGGVVKERKEPKYQLICTHTARRSCITNLYFTGILDTRELMSISGHKTEKAFNEYLCYTNDEMAAKITRKFESIK